VEPETLLRSEGNDPARIVATLNDKGAQALRKPVEAVPPNALSADAPWLVVTVEGASGEYRAGDQVWLRQYPAAEASRHLNRDVLVPRGEGQFAFGRLIEAEAEAVALLPPASGQGRIAVEHPAWVAVAETLVRKL
jgi:hypothetical protein